MSQFTLNNFDEISFLEDFWQQKPTLLMDALPGFESPISADELAGLALEENIESRIIIEKTKTNGSDWLVEHGPFPEDHFQQLPKTHWTLLIQAVDHYLEEVAELKQLFRFIPDWRLDDVMISYAPIGGSVGPHYDQYDVFLIQASGQRIWKTGQYCDDNTALTENQQIKVLKEFHQTQEHCLNPGDILYVPPGIAHWGISNSDDCMTISIGFRAPSHSEIISNSCDFIGSKLTENLRFSDQGLAQNNQNNTHPAEITEQIKQQLQDIIQQHLMNNDQLIESFGELMTQCKYAELQDRVIDTDTLANIQQQGLQLLKAADARIAYYQLGQHIRVFANGKSFLCHEEQESFIQAICDNCIDINHEPLSQEQQDIIDQLLQLAVYDIIEPEYD